MINKNNKSFTSQNENTLAPDTHVRKRQAKDARKKGGAESLSLKNQRLSSRSFRT